MAERIERVSVKDLIRDPFYHAREGRLSYAQVGNLVTILRGGGEFPPVVACRTTKKLVSGWHRVAATEQVDGPAGRVLVEWRSYNNNEERLADAIKESADSALPLNGIDKQRLILRGPEVGLDIEKIAVILSVPVESLRRTIHPAHVSKQDGPLMALKRPQQHLTGGVISEAQAQAVNHSDGRTVAYHAAQIVRQVKNDLVPWDNPRVRAYLSELRDVLNESPLPKAGEKKRRAKAKAAA